jgi:hypothetical protein
LKVKPAGLMMTSRPVSMRITMKKKGKREQKEKKKEHHLIMITQ